MARERSQERTRSPRHSSHHRHHHRDGEDRKRQRSEHDSHHERKRRRTPDSGDRKSKDHDRRDKYDSDRHDRHDRDKTDRRDRRDRNDRDDRRGYEKESHRGREERIKKENSEERQLEALRQGRADRDKKFIKQERERTQYRNENDDIKYQAWLAQEDDFMLIQAKKRAVIRVREGRGKPIDAFVINLKLIEEGERPRVLGDDEIEGDEFYITDPDEVIQVCS
jgi:hypothetical protein